MVNAPIMKTLNQLVHVYLTFGDIDDDFSVAKLTDKGLLKDLPSHLEKNGCLHYAYWYVLFKSVSLFLAQLF